MNTDDLIKVLGATDLRKALKTNTSGTKYKIRGSDEIKGICFHQELGTGSIEAVHKYHTGPNHMAINGLERISYTIGVRSDGEICVLNDIEVKTWSQGDAKRPGDENSEFLSVLFQGAFKYGKETEYLSTPLSDPTSAQLLSGSKLWRECAKFFNLGTKDLYGHYHFGKPACPGNMLKDFIETERNSWDLSDLFMRQKFITEYGFTGNADFQTKVKLTADGIWGPHTEKAAYKWIAQHT